jgi:hypothetical protein
LLELIRLKQLVCIQPEHFSEIEISRAQAVSAEGITELDPEPITQGGGEPPTTPVEEAPDDEPATVEPSRENPPPST